MYPRSPETKLSFKLPIVSPNHKWTGGRPANMSIDASIGCDTPAYSMGSLSGGYKSYCLILYSSAL